MEECRAAIQWKWVPNSSSYGAAVIISTNMTKSLRIQPKISVVFQNYYIGSFDVCLVSDNRQRKKRGRAGKIYGNKYKHLANLSLCFWLKFILWPLYGCEVIFDFVGSILPKRLHFSVRKHLWHICFIRVMPFDKRKCFVGPGISTPDPVSNVMFFWIYGPLWLAQAAAITQIFIQN